MYSCVEETPVPARLERGTNSILAKRAPYFGILCNFKFGSYLLISSFAITSKELASLEMEMWISTFSTSGSTSYKSHHVLFCSQLQVLWQIKHSTHCLSLVTAFALSFASSCFPISISYDFSSSYFFPRSLSWVLHWDLPTGLWVKWRNLQQWLPSSDGMYHYLSQWSSDNYDSGEN